MESNNIFGAPQSNHVLCMCLGFSKMLRDNCYCTAFLLKIMGVYRSIQAAVTNALIRSEHNGTTPNSVACCTLDFLID